MMLFDIQATKIPLFKDAHDFFWHGFRLNLLDEFSSKQYKTNNAMKRIFIVLSLLFFFAAAAQAKPHHPHGRHRGYHAHIHPRPYVVYAAPVIVAPPPPPPVYMPRHYRVRPCHPMPIRRHRYSPAR